MASEPLALEGLEGLVPQKWWYPLALGVSRDPIWQKEEGRVAASPLPEGAAYFYSHAGCWLLARELSALADLPVGAELDPWGRALHVFVVDGDDGVDVFGRWPLRALCREIEAQGGKLALDAGLEELLATLDRGSWKASLTVVRQMLESDEHRACAITAARRVAVAVGLSLKLKTSQGTHMPPCHSGGSTLPRGESSRMSPEATRVSRRGRPT